MTGKPTTGKPKAGMLQQRQPATAATWGSGFDRVSTSAHLSQLFRLNRFQGTARTARIARGLPCKLPALCGRCPLFSEQVVSEQFKVSGERSQPGGFERAAQTGDAWANRSRNPVKRMTAAFLVLRQPEKRNRLER